MEKNKKQGLSTKEPDANFKCKHKNYATSLKCLNTIIFLLTLISNSVQTLLKLPLKQIVLLKEDLLTVNLDEHFNGDHVSYDLLSNIQGSSINSFYFENYENQVDGVSSTIEVIYRLSKNHILIIKKNLDILVAKLEDQERLIIKNYKIIVQGS